MSATTAAGEAVSKRIGEYADGKRDAAQAAEQKAIEAGNPELAAQYHLEASSWDESGDRRIAPQYGSSGSNAGTMCPKGDCGIAYKTPSQQQVADTAGFGATQLDRASAMATALAAAGLTIPYVSVPAEAAAVWASAASWFLNGVQQAASLNFGGYTVSNGISQGTGAITARYPIAAPIINEFGSTTSNSGAAQSAQDWINIQWGILKRKFQ